MSKEFSMEETETLIANFQNGGSPLANYLNELSDVSKIKLPPMPPSIDGFESNLRRLGSARKGMTIIAIEAAIIVAAATSAAALSGIGPEPVVNFVKSTADVVTSTVKKVASIVTGGSNSQEPAPESTAPVTDPSPSTSATTAPSVGPTPSETSTPTPTPATTKSPLITPSAKADPKPTGTGVPSPSKAANNDDGQEDGEENEHSVSTPAPTIKATIMASPKETVTKSSEGAEKSVEKPESSSTSQRPSSTKASETQEKKETESIKSPSSGNDQDD